MGGAWRVAATVTLPSPLDGQQLPTLSPAFAAIPIVQIILGSVIAYSYISSTANLFLPSCTEIAASCSITSS